MARREVKIFPFVGGLIQNISQLFMKPGMLTSAQNYEAALDNGYRRIDGYEAFDGRPAPSEQTFYKLSFNNGTAAMSEGDIITGAAGATGELLIDAVIESGAYATSDAAGYLVLCLVSGTFIDTEDLSVSAVKKSECVGTQSESDESNATTKQTYIQDAMETARGDILDVGNADSCEGAVLGVWFYDDVVYAFRNNSGSTACNMYKHTATGWSLVDKGERIAFTSGGTTTELAEGATVVGAVSGATGLVKRVIIDSGSLAGGDAAGRIILLSKTGAFQAENLDIQGGTANQATVAGDSTAQTLAASGTFRFVNHNFYAGDSTKMMYGCDGVSKGFEFDGTTFVQIDTGMTTDTPSHVHAHKDHLFFAFAGSAQHCDTGLPYKWTGLLGAAEIGVSDTITGFASMPGDVLTIFSRNSTRLLYGNNSTDWELKEHSDEAGAIAGTVQKLGQIPYCLDDLGITSLETTQKYGDFVQGVLSINIDNWIKDNKENIVGSSVSKKKGQYRLFFSDNKALYVTLGTGGLSFMVQDLDIAVACICQNENSSGAEHVYFGAADGFVYQLDKGYNFNGESISAWIRSPFWHVGTPEYKKMIYKLSFEVNDSISSDTTLTIGLEFTDADPGIPATETVDVDIISSGGGAWDEVVWGDFYWDGKSGAKPESYIGGVGTNVRILINSDNAYIEPHTFYSATMHYSMRGLNR